MVHEENCRQAVRSAKTPEDAFEMTGTLQSAMETLNELIKVEQKEGNPEEPGTGPGGQGGAAAAPGKPESEEGSESVLLQSPCDMLVHKIKESKGAAALDEGDVENIRKEVDKMRRLAEANVGLGLMPNSEKKAKQFLENTGVGKMKLEDGDFMAIFTDPGLLGETITAPHIRIPSVVHHQAVIKVG